MKFKPILCLLLFNSTVFAMQLDPQSDEILIVPKLTEGVPQAGRRVRITPPEYAGTEVYHTIYLPNGWNNNGEKLPIIFEYTGNYYPKSGSSGEVKDASLGYGLGGGKCIWVSLPYIEVGGKQNALTWWGDTPATVEYAKLNVPRIIEQFNANPDAVFLCGFSRGAIGVNFIGLHDDEISRLWSAFVTHDHYDGVKQWKKPWGAPLEKYRAEALVRLKRVGSRPYLISQNGQNLETQDYLKRTGVELDNFTFSYINTREVLGTFPNEHAKGAHSDVWMKLPSPYRIRAWEWMNTVLDGQ